MICNDITWAWDWTQVRHIYPANAQNFADTSDLLDKR